MIDYLSKNLAALEKVDSVLYRQLLPELEKLRSHPTGDENEAYHWVDSENKEKNLIYIRKEPPFQALFHGENPSRQAREAVDSIDLRFTNIVVLFGMGLGYVPKHLFAHRPAKLHAVFIIEKNPQMFLRALSLRDWTHELLNRKEIYWFIGDNLMSLNRDLSRFFEIYTTSSRQLKIVHTPNSVEADSGYYRQAAQYVLESRDFGTMLMGNSSEDCFAGFEDSVENTLEALRNPGMIPMIRACQGKTCLSVAAGPDINFHWDTLRECEGKVPMFAADTLLKPMNDRGIAADFYTAIERDTCVTDMVLGQKISPRSSLVAPTVILRESFVAYEGQRLMYCSQPLYTETLRLDFLGRFHTGSSVGNLNLALAVLCGFETIILVGHNLAYGYGTHETHLKGTIDKDRERPRSADELRNEANGGLVETQDGTAQVPTRFEWNLYRKQIELLISLYPNIRWINTSPKGAKIQGAELMDLKDALKLYAKEPFDIHPLKQKLLQPPDAKVFQERQNNTLTSAKITAERCRYWHSKQKEILKKLKGWRQEIETAEAEGRFVSFKLLNSALDEVLKIKTEAINHDPHLYQVMVPITSPMHMAFERQINEMTAYYNNDYDLKKDFLLLHERFFEVWNHFLPAIADRLEWLVEQFPEWKCTDAEEARDKVTPPIQQKTAGMNL